MNFLNSVFAVLLLTSSVIGTTEASSVDNLVSILQTLVATTETYISDVQEQLQNATQEAASLLEEKISEVQTNIANAVSAVSNATQTVETIAGTVANTIANCIVEPNNEAFLVLANTTTSTLNCFATTATAISTQLNELYNISQEALTTASAAQTSADACAAKPFFSELFCNAQLTVSVAAQQTILAGRAALKIAEINALVLLLKDTLTACVAVNFAAGGINIATIISTLASCNASA